MTDPVLDYSIARDHMVDGQIRPNRVTDARLIRAMRSLPRERFLPDALHAIAYADEDVPLAGGRCLMEPLVLAQLIQLARPRPGERALVIGAGVGYGAAVLAACGPAVTALEHDETLLAVARRELPTLAPDVLIVEGDLAGGRPGPWDIVLIEGAVPEIPDALAAQVNIHGGRLVAVLADRPGLGKGVLAEPVGAGSGQVRLRAQPFFDCATPILPAFRRAPSFRF